ncbi:MAG: hypothetical protein WA957_05915, partial [Alteraurantiacibacter sp.]
MIDQAPLATVETTPGQPKIGVGRGQQVGPPEREGHGDGLAGRKAPDRVLDALLVRQNAPAGSRIRSVGLVQR